MKEKSSYLRNSSKSWAMSILDGSSRSDELTLIIVNVPLAVLVLSFARLLLLNVAISIV